GFGGRILPGAAAADRPKYLNTPSTDVYNKSRVLYGLDVAVGALGKIRTPNERVMVVMEGYTDCLMAYQTGYRSAVATCGTALTSHHVGRLKTLADRVVLMFDGDAAGRKAARQSVPLFLGSEVDLRLCVLPDELDPCDYLRRHGLDPFLQRIGEAVDSLEFLIRDSRGAGDLSTLEGKRLALEKVLETMAALPELLRDEQAVKYDLAMRRLAEVFGIPETTVRQRLATIRDEAAAAEDLRRRSAERFENEPAAVRDEAEESASNEMALQNAPYDALEKAVAELLAARPDRALEIAEWFPAGEFQHPALRRIATAAGLLAEGLGPAATTDRLREAVDEGPLSARIVHLADEAPTGDAFERAMADYKTEKVRRREQQIRATILQRLKMTADPTERRRLLQELNDL
ncbi:MAG: toprim domain-containing protein, partial [Planctomycetia bacterium]